MKAEDVAKEVDRDPIHLFQNQRRNTDAPIVLGDVDAPKLVFDDGDEGGEQHELGNVVVNQEALDHDGGILREDVRVDLDTI